MKSIVFFFLLLLVVATSENVRNGWYNLTGLHEDEWIWDSLGPMKEYLTYNVLQGQKICGSSMTDPCTGTVNGKKYGTCRIYTRCKRLIVG